MYKAQEQIEVELKNKRHIILDYVGKITVELETVQIRMSREALSY